MRTHNAEFCIRNINRKPIKQSLVNDKPEGFWYALNDEWREWCKANDQLQWIGRYNYELDIKLANILILDSDEKILEFSKIYDDIGFPLYKGHRIFINWAKVSQEFEGIEISSFNSQMIFNPQTSWLYGWDVASGCIWNMEKIKIKPIKI